MDFNVPTCSLSLLKFFPSLLARTKSLCYCTYQKLYFCTRSSVWTAKKT